jgi:hypothetical protein
LAAGKLISVDESPPVDVLQLKALIRQDPLKLAELDPQPADLCLELVSAQPELIGLVRKQSSQLKKIVLSKDGLLIKHIRHPTEEDFLLAIKDNIQALWLLQPHHLRTKRLFEVAPLLNYRALAMLSPWWTDSCDKHIVSRCAVCGPIRCLIGDAPPPERGLYQLTEEAYIAIAEVNGLALEYITRSDQTERTAWAALEQNPRALQFIAKQTAAMCEYAVTQDVETIVYSNIKNRAIKNVALAKDPSIFNFDHMVAWRFI